MKKYVTGLIILVVLFVLGTSLGYQHNNSTPTKQPPSKLYVALGDSVAAGVGLKDDSDSSACDRTNQAYPDLVATALHYNLRNIACSGATLPAGILGKQTVNQLAETPQLQQLFAGPTPNLMTITVGANDVGWTTVLAKCYTGECGDSADTAAVTANLTTVTTNLESLLNQVQAHYGTKVPQVIVTGYHQVFPATEPTDCTDLMGIDAAELAWGRQLQTNISTTLQQATSNYSFVRYVPVNFSGHELCTTDSWVQGLLDKQPYHPTSAGQAEFAKEIEQAVKAYN